jgi:hypothetical protein
LFRFEGDGRRHARGRRRTRNIPKAVPETIRSSIGPSSAGGAMLVGVDEPLGVTERENPRRPKKLVDLEEIVEAALVGVEGLRATCCAATLRSELWRDGVLEGRGVS